MELVTLGKHVCPVVFATGQNNAVTEVKEVTQWFLKMR